MSSGANLGRNCQMITAGNTGWRVQHDSLTDRITLRIKRLLHAQGAAMPVFAQHRAFALAGEAKMQLGECSGCDTGRRAVMAGLSGKAKEAGNTQECAVGI